VVVTVSQSMPLVIAFGFFILIVVVVLLGSHLFGPDSWPLQSDREEARRARVGAEHAEQLRQRLRGAMLGEGDPVAEQGADHVELVPKTITTVAR